MSTSESNAVAVVEACLTLSTQEAWIDFVRSFQPLIASVIIRSMRRYGNVDRALTDDLIQETYVRLCKDDCKALRQFEHRHQNSIYGFIKVVAASVVMDHFRSYAAEKRSGEVASLSEDCVSVIPSRQEDLDHPLLMREISVQLERITENERDRSIFWLYYQQGYSANDISKIPGIHLSAKGVESCILRLTQALRREMNIQTVKKDQGDEGLLSQPPLGEVR